MTKNKRIISFFLAFAIIISGIEVNLTLAQDDVSVVTKIDETNQNTPNKDSDIPKIEEEVHSEENIGADEVKKSENEEVRVIIELKKDSILEEANRKDLNFSELSDDFIKEKKEEIEIDQDKLLEELEEMKIESDLNDVIKYDTVLNGIALTVKQKDISNLEENPNVENVFISQEFNRPLMKSAQDNIGSSYAWDTKGYKGEGTVVAIIDSGIDYTHSALILDNETRARYDKNSINEAISNNELKGRFYTSKVPYGHNYYDHNDNLFDSYGSMHGMHVSGIVGANDKDNDIYGVAPNTQILAMKVFSDDLQYPTTFTDIWLKALDDAIALKADVINMSLGSPAGISYEGKHHPEIEIFRKAKEAGIVISVAAGNEGSITDGNTYGVKPLQENYDTGLIANPALTEDSIAVAAIENLKKHVYAIEWKNLSSNVVSKEAVNLFVPDGAAEEIKGKFVDLKTASDEEIKAKHNDIAGKIVFVQIPKKDEKRDLNSALAKIIANKPLAILLYRSSTDVDSIRGKISLVGELSKYTVGIMRHKTYKALVINQKLDKNFEINIRTKEQEVTNESSGKMSTFSSWGPTPDLRIKPEIAAYGGHIYSLAENQKYRSLSGTSMAAPQVTGAVAIIKQYLKEQNLPQDPDFIKLLLMNTADPIENPDSNGGTTPYFVRQQGAGKINLDRALMTKVVVRATGTNDTQKDGKLELKQIAEKKFEVDLEFENFGDKEQRFYIYPLAIKDEVLNGYRLQVGSHLLSEADNINEEVVVPPNSKLNRRIVIDYTDSDLEINNFLEGFINIISFEGKEYNLTVPFLGFYGDWTSQKSIDAFNINELDSPERRAQFLVNKDANTKSSLFMTRHSLGLPIVENILYFSPNSEYHKEVVARIAPLRNMEEIEYSILDYETKKVLRVIGKSDDVRKLSRLNTANSFRTMPDSLWDGKIREKLIDENKKYIYQIKTKLNNNGVGGHGEQIYQYPIKIDTKAPAYINEPEVSTVNERLKKVKFTVEDEGTGIDNIYLQSLKYVDSVNISNPDSPLYHGIDATPSGRVLASDLSENSLIGSNFENKSENQVVRKPQYGKFVKIILVDYPEKDGKVLNKVNDGKVIIDDTQVPSIPDTDVEIHVYRNNHKNKAISFEVPFYADRSHIHISTKDFLSNRGIKTIETGEKNSFSSVIFSNHMYQIVPNKAKVYVNGKELNTLRASIEGKDATIKIVYDGKSSHIKTLGIKQSKIMEYPIKDDKYNSKLIPKYDFKVLNDENAIEFKLKNIEVSTEIITLFGNGPMPELLDTKIVNLNLNEADVNRFSDIKLNSKDIILNRENSVIQIENGTNLLEFVFDKKNPNSYSDVESVSVIQNGIESKLSRTAYFDLIGGTIGYSFSKYSINVNLQIKDDAILKIKYKSSQKSDFMGTNDENKQSEVNNTKDKYPVVFIESPALLEVLTRINADEGEFNIIGFIGNIKPNDKIKHVEISLVDEDGNLFGESFIIDGNELEPEFIKIGKEQILYDGIGYRYSKVLKASDFNTNVRVEVVTESGEKAGVTRRLFYDNITPELSYLVEDRDLTSDSVKLRIRSTDNSLKLSLYHEDSLISKEDKTKITFQDNGVEIEKEIDIPLEIGQNEIKIKSVDMASYVTEKIIYIYRTDDSETVE